MSILASVFFCIGAVDYLLGNKFRLGENFYKGMSAIIELLMLMAGFIVLAPWINTTIAPFIGPVFTRLGCDPSLFAGMFLSSDGGAAILAKEMELTEQAGLYNGMIVGSFMGITIVCTIPLVLSSTKGAVQESAVKGLLIGFLTIPFGCVFTGMLSGIPLSIIIRNTWPVFILVMILMVLFRVFGNRIVFLFQALAFFIRVLALFGFSLAVLQESTGVLWIDNLTALSEVFPIICHIGVFLAGILPLMTVLQYGLSKGLNLLGKKLRISSQAVADLFVSLANPIPVMTNDLMQMDERSCMINVAFLTTACFAIGDHLAFAMQFSPRIAMPLMVGKIMTGLLGILVACFWNEEEP